MPSTWVVRLAFPKEGAPEAVPNKTPSWFSTKTTGSVPLPKIILLASRVVAPVPPLATERVPVTVFKEISL